MVWNVSSHDCCCCCCCNERKSRQNTDQQGWNKLLYVGIDIDNVHCCYYVVTIQTQPEKYSRNGTTTRHYVKIIIYNIFWLSSWSLLPCYYYTKLSLFIVIILLYNKQTGFHCLYDVWEWVLPWVGH